MTPDDLAHRVLHQPEDLVAHELTFLAAASMEANAGHRVREAGKAALAELSARLLSCTTLMVLPDSVAACRVSAAMAMKGKRAVQEAHFVPTGVEADGPCPGCGAAVHTAELRSVATGGTVTRTDRHNAPCGFPCILGGVSAEQYRAGQFHRVGAGSACPCTADVDGGVE